jgi:hypothetical protein
MKRKQYVNKEWRILNFLMLQVGYYDNRTNLKGARFFHSNIFFGPIHYHITLDWLAANELRGIERGFEISYLTKIKYFRQLRFQVKWIYSDFVPDPKFMHGD